MDVTEADFHRCRTQPGGDCHHLEKSPKLERNWQLRHLKTVNFPHPVTGKPVRSVKVPKDYHSTHRIKWLQEICNGVSNLRQKGSTVYRAYRGGDYHWYDTLLSFVTNGRFWGGFARKGVTVDKPQGPFKWYAEAIFSMNAIQRDLDSVAVYLEAKKLERCVQFFDDDRQSQSAISDVFSMFEDDLDINDEAFSPWSPTEDQVDTAENSKAILLDRLAHGMCETLWQTQRRQLVDKTAFPPDIARAIKNHLRS